jgi:glycosyltransferase involved in cell wall biosynthesis
MLPDDSRRGNRLAIPLYAAARLSDDRRLRAPGDLVRATCIMPTCDRRAFVPRAVRLFLAQDLPDLELVILDDGADPVADCVPSHPRIRYLRAPRRMTVGAKRNALCREASGAVILHWDDDDWYPPWRARAQCEALQARAADLCGSSIVYYREPATGRAWRFEAPADQGVLAGNTLAYRRDFWERTPFLDVSVCEDVHFQRHVRRERVVDLADPRLCVATLHRGNVSPKRVGGSAWHPHPPEALAALTGEASPPAGPLRVSCIMPTADRRAFVALALERFAAQDHPDRELVVVDDGADPVADLCAALPGVRYVRLARRASIGAKRDLACREATGDVVAHWDDDDWYGAGRLRAQIEPIAAGRADVTGLVATEVLDLADGARWNLDEKLHRRLFEGDVHGGTLMFRRSFLADGVHYPDRSLGEDAALLQQLLQRGARLERVDGDGLFVYTRHGRNAWRFEAGRFLDPAGWRRVERPAAMSSEHQARYRAAAGALTVVPPVTSPRRGWVDCLGSAEVVLPVGLPPMDRCIAAVASDACAPLLDDMLASLDRFGGLAGVPRVVFVEEGGIAAAVAARRGAQTVTYRPLRRPSPALKGLLYSAAHALDAARFLLLDVDLLVLDDLAALFETRDEHVRCAAESIPGGSAATLGDALRGIYRAETAEVGRLCGDPRVEACRHVINDGVMIAGRDALLAVDETLRASPELVAWVHADPRVRWRQKAALNVALARLGRLAVLDPTCNVQLHVEHVERVEDQGRLRALWQGRCARVLHFNGSARPRMHGWARDALGAATSPR